MIGACPPHCTSSPSRRSWASGAVEGHDIRVAGLDAVDGTPVLDIKPVMAEFLARGELRQPAWSRELMAGYWRSS
jgi:tRNA (Thr-GGU) A37 N-methylase